MDTPSMLGTLCVFALALAGCSGSYEIEQTEPVRVQLEGPAETVNVSDQSEARVVVENPDKVEDIAIEVDVRATSGDNVTVHVVVRDEETNEELANKTISTNTTQPPPADADPSDPSDPSEPTDPVPEESMKQTIIVKGKGNVVVIAQTHEGTADVDISAREASGNMTA